MVGIDSGITMRKALIAISSNTNTSIEYWEKKSLFALKPWSEALKEGAENSG